MAGSSYATASRRKILEYLKNSNDHTVTAADVDEYLREHDSEVNITTIYRYLDKLAKDGTVIKYVAEKGCQAAYQYVEPGRGCETAPASEMCEMWKDYSSGVSFYGRNFSSH